MTYSVGTISMLVLMFFSHEYVSQCLEIFYITWFSDSQTYLLSQRAVLNKDNNFEVYKQAAENFMCKILPNSPSSSTKYTQGNLNIHENQ